MRLIVGLGNPGRQYALTRHNVGFRCVDELARRAGVSSWRRLFDALVATFQLAGQKVMLAKPQTFMNLSGEAVARLMRYYGVAPRDLLVIYDDMDLPVGKLRIREAGSSGGHKGMVSIIAAIGTEAFPRLRIGIGRPRALDATGHVLGRFDAADEPAVAEALGRAADAVETILSEGIVAAMNRYNS